MAKVPAAVFCMLGPLALGCVNLDKPALVAACSEAAGGCEGKVQPDGSPDGQPNPDAGGSVDQAGGPVGDGRVLGADGDIGAPDAGPDRSTGSSETPAALDGAGDEPLNNVDAAPDKPADGAGTGPDGADLATLPDAPGTVPMDTQPDTAGRGDTGGTEAGNGFDTGAAERGNGLDTGGAADSGTTGNTVTFSAGLASGPMTGYGWATVGTADSIGSPTCGADATPITGANPCAAHPNWTSPAALCVTGSVLPLPADPTSADYAADWGLEVGVNAKVSGNPIGKSFSTIAVNFTGLPSSGLRVELHLSTDPTGTTYCHLLTSATSGTPFLLTSFNTACWDGTGVAFAAADAAQIDMVGVEVTPNGTEPIAVTNLCLTSIVFGD